MKRIYIYGTLLLLASACGLGLQLNRLLHIGR